MLSPLFQLEAATLAARMRTGDATIGTQLQGGCVQVVRVTYPVGKRGQSRVVPASGWLALADAVAHLGALQ